MLAHFDEFEELIKPFQAQSIKSLSGGQNQIVKIITSLFLSGDIFFLDEPLQYLDKGMREKVKMILLRLKEMGKTLVIIEHLNDFDPEFIEKIFLLESNGEEIVVANGI